MSTTRPLAAGPARSLQWSSTVRALVGAKLCVVLAKRPRLAALDWIAYGASTGTTAVNAFVAGRNTVDSADFLLPCGTFSSWGSNVIMRINMGGVEEARAGCTRDTRCAAD